MIVPYLSSHPRLRNTENRRTSNGLVPCYLKWIRLAKLATEAPSCNELVPQEVAEIQASDFGVFCLAYGGDTVYRHEKGP